jgi:hypothetical protein
MSWHNTPLVSPGIGMGLGFFGLIGLSSAAAGVYFFVDDYRFVRTAATAEGVVVNHAGDHCVIEFTTASGRKYTFTEPSASDPPDHAIGQRVTVAYDPRDPYRWTVDSFMGRSYLPIFLWLFGMLFMCIGVCIYAHLRRTA